MRSERYYDVSWMRYQSRPRAAATIPTTPTSRNTTKPFSEHCLGYHQIDEVKQNYYDNLFDQREEVCFWSILVSVVLTGVAMVGIILLIL